MKTLKFSALLLGAVLFLGLGASSLSAKCGGDMDMSKDKKEAKKDMKCGAGKCGGDKKADMKKEAKKDMKCGSDKCGSGDKKADMAKEKKGMKKDMKCGAGKCG